MTVVIKISRSDIKFCILGILECEETNFWKKMYADNVEFCFAYMLNLKKRLSNIFIYFVGF